MATSHFRPRFLEVLAINLDMCVYSMGMNRTSYKQALADAQKELQELFRKREDMERQIARLRQSIVAISRLCEPDATRNPRAHVRETTSREGIGLTDAVRTALMVSRTPLNATQVRDTLENVGYDPGASPNTLVSIHTVLGRLAQSGELKEVGIKHKTGREKGRYGRISFWWGEWGIPKPWVVYDFGAIQRKRARALEREKAREATKAGTG